MFSIVLMMFFVTNVLAVLVIGLGLSGYCGPKWSQRWGNVIVVLSVVALLLKLGAPPGSVWIPFFDEWSCVLAIIGAVWGALGDVVCLAVRSKGGWARYFRAAIRE